MLGAWGTEGTKLEPQAAVTKQSTNLSEAWRGRERSWNSARTREGFNRPVEPTNSRDASILRVNHVGSWGSAKWAMDFAHRRPDAPDAPRLSQYCAGWILVGDLWCSWVSSGWGSWGWDLSQLRSDSEAAKLGVEEVAEVEFCKDGSRRVAFSTRQKVGSRAKL